MRSGEYRTLITIEHVTRAQDDVLNLKEKWEEFAKCWAAATVEPGSETQPEQQTIAQNTWTWETHWTPTLAAVTAQMRVVTPGGKPLPIRSVVNVGNLNRTLLITCEETN